MTDAADAVRGRALAVDRRSGPLALLIAVGALALVAGVAGLLLLATGGSPAPPPRSPFGVGLREGGGSATGLVGWILAVQSGFYRSLVAALRAMKADGASGLALAGLSFAYGAFHAAGPGHGKAVISAYILANERALRRGFALVGAAALLQAVVAVAIVGVLAALLGATAARMAGVAHAIELASFGVVALVGAVLLWRKSRALAAGLAGDADASCGPDCGHAPLLAPAGEGAFSWREAASTVVAAGLRPCSGAIVVLVFALSQGLFAAGIAAVLAMAAGTALTTGGLAAVAVFMKGAALRLASGRGAGGLIAVRGLETLAAALLLTVGLALFLGVWAGGQG